MEREHWVVGAKKLQYGVRCVRLLKGRASIGAGYAFLLFLLFLQEHFCFRLDFFYVTWEPVVYYL